MEKIIISSPKDIWDQFTDYVAGSKKGVIQLTVPVANINEWEGQGLAAYPLALGISREDFEKVLYYTACVVQEVGQTEYTPGQIISWEDAALCHENGLVVLSGMEAVQCLLALSKDAIREKTKNALAVEREKMAEKEALYEEYKPDECDLTEEQELHLDRCLQALGEARAMLDATSYVSQHADRLSVHEINVLPLQVRTILREEADRLPYSVFHDLEYQYVRIVNRNNRVKRLIQMQAPDIILRNEKRILQENVDSLIANGRRGNPSMKNREDERCALASLTDIVLHNIRMV